jgi:hypothetical protein
MLLKKKSNDFLILLGAISTFATALIIHQKKTPEKIEISKQESATNINRELLRIFSIGNKKLISNSIWIQTLLESDEEQIKDHKTHSWMYHRFKTIAILDPKFYENYLWGGMYLSIIKDDLEGAAEIYDLGLKHYPDDYNLNYNSGFNLYFEMDNFKDGLSRLEKIQSHPKAPWRIKFLVNKLKFETEKNFNQALEFLNLQLFSTQDAFLKRKIEDDIKALITERDLNCLNSKLNKCSTIDPYGNPYVFKNNFWSTAREYKRYKIFKKKKEE